MSKDHVAVAFSNGMGNFIFYTAALKVLKNWGYDDITLITDERVLRKPFMQEVFEGLFEEIVTKCDVDAYDRIFTNNWFVPACMRDQLDLVNPRYRTVNWHHQGIHEVQLYLESVGASWRDFDGYLLEPDKTPVLRSSRPRIALANCSTTNQAVKKRWLGFPELSKVLDDMGFTVVLLGIEDELAGCVGVNYLDKLTVKQSAKVLQQCDLLISVSTGLSVVADVVKTPVLLIEGPMPTFKAHPIMSKYSVVRKYISCAPCFQKSLWKHCTEPTCMDRITVGDVLQKMFEFMPQLDKPLYEWGSPASPPLVKSKKVKAEGRVCYLVAVNNRSVLLNDFLESFKACYPPEGYIVFVDDASSDPRVMELLEAFEVDGIEKRIIHVTPAERAQLLREHPNTGFSKPVYNRMIDEGLKLGGEYDYVVMTDSDIIMKPYWVQRCILIWNETKHLKVATVSGFSGWHPDYDQHATTEIFESSAGSYRIRDGNNFPYLMSADIFENVHGYFDLDARVGSSDISKNTELQKKGYKAVALVPSQTEHWGAFETSFGRGKPSLMSGDYV